jgi:hypothetical protein
MVSVVYDESHKLALFAECLYADCRGPHFKAISYFRFMTPHSQILDLPLTTENALAYFAALATKRKI